jgi:hypothetical protein
LPGTPTAEQRAAINRDIYRRARRFVKSFKVDSSRTMEGESELVVIAKVDRDQIKQALDRIGVAKSAGQSTAAAGGPRPKVIALASWSSPAGARSARELRSLARSAVTELGFEVADEGQVPVSSQAGGQLPLSDDEGAALAKSRKAGGAFLAGIQSRPDGTIRGTTLVGAVATASVRVVDDSGTVVGKVGASAAGYGPSSTAAQSRAGSEALRRALAKLRRPLDRYWPPVKATLGGVTVSMTGLRSHVVLQAIERHLAASRSPIRIIRRRLSSGMVQLVVDSKLSPGRLAAIISSAPVPSASVAARARDGQVEVRVRDFSGGGS